MSTSPAVDHAHSSLRRSSALFDDAARTEHERSAVVIDLGSNTWRLVAYRYAPRAAWRRIAELQEPVRIARGLAATGRLDPDRVARGLEAIETFARYCRALGVRPRDVEVVATSALRDAADGPEFLARARELAGLEIRALTADEEARYGCLAAVNSTSLRDGLTLDLGGGSLQLVSVRDRAARGVASWPLGAVRVTEELLPGGGPAARKQLKRARAAIRDRLDGLQGLPAGDRRMVGMGGAVRNLANAAMVMRHAVPTGVQGALLAAGELRNLIGTLARRPASRRALPGIKPGRADIILAAALVLEAALDLAGVGALEVTRAGLREGVFFASGLFAGASPVIPDVRGFGIRNVAVQHSVDLRQAEHVAALALGLHDSLTAARGATPGGEERELLWAAAMLHEIGMSIQYDGHPTHSRYLILNSELPGYGPRDVALLAQIVRYHRKGTPGLDDLQPLARPGDRELVARCALLLRLAAELAPGHDRAISQARLVPEGNDLRLVLSGDDRLARRTVARQTPDDDFRWAFGRRLLPTG